MNESIRILIVEDMQTDAELAMREIRKSVQHSEFQRVETEAAFLDALETFNPDLILSDYQLPRFTGMQALKLATQQVPLTPLIIYTGSINEDIAVECMKAGAYNYIIKENTKRLGMAVVHALGERKVRTERQQSMDALRASEARFSMVFHASPMAIAITRLSDNKLIDVNETWQELTGFSKEEAIGNSSTSLGLLDPEARERFLKELTMHGIVRGFEFQLHKKSGGLAHVLFSAEMAEIEGEPCMISMALDITERKKIEKALHASEERFHALVQNSADLIVVINQSGVIQYTSPTSERILGYVPEETINRNFLEWVHPEDISIAIESLASRSREPGTANQSIEVRGLHKDGAWRIIEVLGTNLLGDPVINGIVLNMRDVTERKKSETALFQAEERFHKAFFSGPVGLAITNASSGIYIEANEAFSSITGFSREELLNHTSLELGITTHEQRSEYQHLMKEQGFIRNREMKLRHKSGAPRVVLGSMEIIELNHEICVLSTAIDISERNQAIMALQESEEKYRALFQNAQVGMFRTKLDDSALLAVNPKFCEVLGYSEEELLSKPSAMLWAAPFAHKQMTAELKTKKTIQEYEIEMHTKSGDLRTCLISAQFIPGEDYMEGSLLDITSRKQAEDWISRLNRQLELILNSAGEGIYGMDSEGRITFINPAMARMIGWDIADLLSHSMHEICHHTHSNGEPFPKEDCPIFSAFKDGAARHSELDFYWRKDGTMFPVEYTSTPIRESGKLVGTVVLVSDITNRLQAEDETRQHMTEMEMLYESGLALSQLMTPKEIGQKIIELLEQKMDWHHTAIRLYHPGEDDALQLLAFSQPGMQTPEEVSAVEKNFKRHISKVGEGLSGWAIQNSQIVRSGDVSSDPRYRDTYPGLHSGLYVPMKLGNDVFGVISIESEKPNAFSEADERLVATLANQAAVAFENASLYQTAQQEIIERRRIEQLLAEERNQLALRVEERTADLSHANMDLERALRVKDEFLASMSHELRTPLTGILGFSEALQLMAYGELSERQLKTIKSIEDSGRHLLELINDILDLSKIEAGKLELQFAVCSITDICQSSLMLIKGMANQKRQMIDYSPTAEPIAIYADSRRIKQILVNLLSNAVKFTPENGELGLEIETIPSEQKIKLCVWDKGIGIKPADMEKLFKPFTQIDSSLAREYSGTGLGLSLANRLAELHNGAIQVESSPGAGSRFTVTLPWSPQEAIQSPVTYETSGEANPETPEAIMSSLIMIADDNETVLEMLAEFLETIRFRVARVHSGAELLEKAGETLPDIMLVDIQMPGMDGLETIQRIRKHKNPLVATTTVIAVTALAMPGDRERCLQAGANEYISKPVKLQELSELIQKLIKR